MKKSFIALTATAVAIGSASAATIMITPTADAHIRSDNKPGNFGTSTTLLMGTNGATTVFNALLRYSLANLYAATGGLPITINSVKLDFSTATDGGGTLFPITLALQTYGFAFDEATATYENPATGDATPGGTAGTELSTVKIDSRTGGQSYTFGNTTGFVSNVQSAYDAGSTSTVNYRITEQTLVLDQSFIRVNSKEAGSTAPALVIDYTVIPEPSSTALIGLVGLGCILRRRR